MINILLPLLLLCPAVTWARVKCNDTSYCPDGNTCCAMFRDGYDCCTPGWKCSTMFLMCVPLNFSPYPNRPKSLPNPSVPALKEIKCPGGSQCANDKKMDLLLEFKNIHNMRSKTANATDVTCDDGTHCPDGTTCCDSILGYICCPEGWTCDTSAKTCLPSKMENTRFALKDVIVSKATSGESDVICTDGSHCPDGTTCCNSIWGYVCCLEGWACFTSGCLPSINGNSHFTLENGNKFAFKDVEASSRESDVICSDGSHCPDSTTCCDSFVGYICCPGGFTCDTTTKICLPSEKDISQLENENEYIMEDKSVKAATGESGVLCADGRTHCQNGTTCCNSITGFTCCPEGWTCDTSIKICIPSKNENSQLALKDEAEFVSIAGKSASGESDVICPSGSHCIDGNSCCVSLFGYVCCPDFWRCTSTGCIPSEKGNLHFTPKNEYKFVSKAVEAASGESDVTCPDGSNCQDGSTCCESDTSYVCCQQGWTCDPTAKRCLPFSGMNPELEQSNENGTGFSTAEAASGLAVVQCSDGSHCPNGNTCCIMTEGGYGCCPMPNAVCCSNDKCCPQGEICLSSLGICVHVGTSKSKLHMSPMMSKTPSLHNPLVKGIAKKGASNAGYSKSQNFTLSPRITEKVVYCPGGQYYCPDGNTCCPSYTGLWHCCPYPSASCCADMVHCCPAGFRCSATSLQCLHGFLSQPMSENTDAKLVSNLEHLHSQNDVK